MEHGIITIPSVRKDPLETLAPKFFISYETLARDLISSIFQSVSMRIVFSPASVMIRRASTFDLERT